MIRKLHLIPALALALVAPAVVNADTIVLTYTGTLGPQANPLAPDFASYTLTLTFDPAATRLLSNNVNTDTFAIGGSLTLNGVTHSLTEAWEYTGATRDSIHIIPASGPSSIDIYLPLGFTGAVSATNTLTPFGTADVTGDLWFFSGGGGASTYESRTFSASWTRQTDPQPPTPSVPEPASLLLLGAGVLGLAARRRS